MKLNEIIEYDKKYFMNVFGERTKVCFERGSGINLWDTDGKMYYDFFAGIAVSALGHSHPKLVATIKDQAEKFLHCSNIYYIESQALLAKALVENSCADRVFFSNSGAEANEGAIKLARIFFKKKGISDKYEIITLNNSFHGRTMATLSATGQEKYQKNFVPLLERIVHVPINDLEKLKGAVNEKTCAVMLELVQGESGVHMLTQEYLEGVRKVCDDNGILLIFDEVQTGMGRTGKLFAYQHYNVEPDIFTLAKALAGGIPIGALLAKEHVASAFEPGDHGSTFGGNPFACACALCVMEVMLNDGAVENSERMGKYFVDKLNGLKTSGNLVKEVRGIGLMIAIELSEPKAKQIKSDLLEAGYLIGNVGDNILRILPPLIIKKEHIDGFVDCLSRGEKAWLTT